MRICYIKIQHVYLFPKSISINEPSPHCSLTLDEKDAEFIWVYCGRIFTSSLDHHIFLVERDGFTLVLENSKEPVNDRKLSNYGVCTYTALVRVSSKLSSVRKPCPCVEERTSLGSPPIVSALSHIVLEDDR